jgi:hypothetical protein
VSKVCNPLILAFSLVGEKVKNNKKQTFCLAGFAKRIVPKFLKA